MAVVAHHRRTATTERARTHATGRLAGKTTLVVTREGPVEIVSVMEAEAKLMATVAIEVLMPEAVTVTMTEVITVVEEMAV
jgi:hypothetical protein